MLHTLHLLLSFSTPIINAAFLSHCTFLLHHATLLPFVTISQGLTLSLFSHIALLVFSPHSPDIDQGQMIMSKPVTFIQCVAKEYIPLTPLTALTHMHFIQDLFY